MSVGCWLESSVSTQGEPIIGGSIIEKGKASNGTITDLDGKFSLSVSGKGEKLVVFYIGMTTHEADAVGGKVLKIILRDDAQALDEVVVIGYGTSKRGDLTGSIASVDKKIERYSRHFCRIGYHGASCRCKCNHH